MKNYLYVILLIVLTTCLGYSKSYSIDRIRIQAEVLDDGSMKIVENRTYTFNGEYSWADYKIPLDKVGNINLFSLREGSQNYYKGFDETPGCYIIENQENAFYVKWFYQAEDQTRTFTLKYLVTDAVKVYNDIAELYYKFIGETNPKNIGTVDVNIKLPQYASKDSVKIWLHAPLHGNINFKDGLVILEIQQMPAEQFFEVRIIFPTHWIPFSENIHAKIKLENIISQEKLWAAEANRIREKAKDELIAKKEKEREALPYAIITGLACLLMVFWFYKKYGKPHRISYNLKVDSVIPTNIHPAIVNGLFFNKQIQGSAISTTIFDLARRDIIAIEQVKPKNKKWYQPKTQYVFKLNRAGWNEIKSQMKNFENNMLQFFFDELGNGEDQINTLLFKKHSTKMRRWFEKWKKLLKSNFDHIRVYDKKSRKFTAYSALISALVVIAGVLIILFIGFPGIIMLIAGLLSFVLSFTILRYTEEMKIKRKKWNALKKYLQKYHFINESDLSWQSQINEYLVYGIALGIGKKTIEKMISVIPADQRSIYFPWYIYAYHAASSPADFASALTSVVAVASSTVSSAAGAGGGAGVGGGGGGGGAAGGAG